MAFRFSRFGEKGVQLDEALRVKLAEAMTTGTGGADPDSGEPGTSVPAGFTYLGQFVDHDLTLDRTQVGLGEPVPVEDLVQGRSPALDLDSLYGLGPHHAGSARFYESDGRLRTGTTLGVGFPPESPSNIDHEGFDLPRAGEAAGGTRADRRAPLIPDARNDENLAVGQLHLAFIRFHNRVVDLLAERGVPEHRLFKAARDIVVKHYQWMLRTDFLPRIVDPDIVERVFTRGRRHFERPGYTRPGDLPTMPIEFSVAAYRLGHSMVRGAYQWNSVFRAGGPGPIASLGLLFRFSGTAGNLTPGPDDLSDLDDPNAGRTYGCRATGSSTSAGCSTSARSAGVIWSCPRVSSTWPSASTRFSSTRWPRCPPAPSTVVAARPRRRSSATSRSATSRAPPWSSWPPGRNWPPRWASSR